MPRSAPRSAILLLPLLLRIPPAPALDADTTDLVLAGSGETIACPPPEVRTAGPGFRRGEFRTFTQVDGLPAAELVSLFEDRAGSLWMGTRGGALARYNGARFEVLTQEHGLPGGDVTAFAQDSRGDMWFIAHGRDPAGIVGLYRYDGVALTRFDTSDGLPSGLLRDLDVDAGDAIWVATPKGAVRYDGRHFTTLTREDGVSDSDLFSVLVDSRGRIWLGSRSGQVTRLDSQGTASFDAADGLTAGPVVRIWEDQEGSIWFFGLGNSGVSVYTNGSFQRYRQGKGLPEPWGAAQDRDGRIWFTTNGSWVYRAEGSRFTRIGPDTGLPSVVAWEALVDSEGTLWFGTSAGLSQYLGERIHSFTGEEFEGNRVFGMAEDGDHQLWLATSMGLTRYDRSGTFTTYTPPEWQVAGPALTNPSPVFVSGRGDGLVWLGARSGLYSFDGKGFSTYTTEDGLAGDWVTEIAEDQSGALWVASWGQGLSRQSGSRFEVVNTQLPVPPKHVRAIVPATGGGLWVGSFRSTPGLYFYDGTRFVDHSRSPSRLPQVTAIALDSDETPWIGTWDSGIARYDDHDVTFYGVQEGVASNWVTSLLIDGRGRRWIGTFGGGVSVCDDTLCQNLTIRDGLPDNNVECLYEDHAGDVWISTWRGLCRYRPLSRVPSVMVTDVVTSRPLGPRTQVALPSSQGYLRVAFADLPEGSYRLHVRAVDQDLNYSDPAIVDIRVYTSYQEPVTRGALLLSLLGLTVAGTYGLRRRAGQRRAERVLMQEMEAELRDARRMQMGLMPASAPEVPGVRMAARCVSANDVGGDFFQYFEHGGKVAVGLADVTGHKMEAAIPAVMFSGILDNQMEQPKPLPELFRSLNRSLCRSLGEHTYVCLSMLDIDPASRSMRVANCGCPYPLHYHPVIGQIDEIQVEAYPLGIRPDTEYAAKDVSLEPGDYVVLHSDGFSEATNAGKQLFGFDRTMEVIRQGCSEGLSPEDLIERLIGEVKAFTGDEPQADDMTCVVIKVEV